MVHECSTELQIVSLFIKCRRSFLANDAPCVQYCGKKVRSSVTGIKTNNRHNIHMTYTSCIYVQLNCKGKQLIFGTIRANRVLNMQHFDEKQTS